MSDDPKERIDVPLEKPRDLDNEFLTCKRCGYTMKYKVWSFLGYKVACPDCGNIVWLLPKKE